MKPAPFTYHRPTDVGAALALLADLHAAEQHAKVLAGGQSLLPLLSMRLASPGHLVDANALPGLDGVDVGPGGVCVGALVRHRALERHDGAAEAAPLLRQALQHVAHPTIRNRGTTVGSLCHADASGEMPAVIALLGGSVTALSTRGERTIAAADFFVGPLESALAPDELAVAASFPLLPAGSGTAVCEVARRHGDYAVCGVVALVRLVDGCVAEARAGYVSAGDDIAPVDLTEAVRGAEASAASWGSAGELAREVVATEPDIHASADYRSQLVAVLTERALRAAAGSAEGTAVAA